MPARSQARWLAPIALVSAAVAVYAVVAPRGGDDGASAGERTPAAAQERPSPATPTSTTRARRARTYTVRPGDTLSAIAERTGVPLATLTRLNEGVDSQALQAGQRLKLAP